VPLSSNTFRPMRDELAPKKPREVITAKRLQVDDKINTCGLTGDHRLFLFDPRLDMPFRSCDRLAVEAMARLVYRGLSYSICEPHNADCFTAIPVAPTIFMISRHINLQLSKHFCVSNGVYVPYKCVFTNAKHPHLL